MDKENVIVVLNTTDYIYRMNKIMDDKNKFKKLDFNLNCKKQL